MGPAAQKSKLLRPDLGAFYESGYTLDNDGKPQFKFSGYGVDLGYDPKGAFSSYNSEATSLLQAPYGLVGGAELENSSNVLGRSVYGMLNTFVF